MNDPYWTLDTSLFEGTFRYFGKEPVLVRGKVHTEEERYSLRPAARERLTISTLRGTRTYFHMEPFVLLRDIRVMIGLYQRPTPAGQVGEVLSSQEAPRMKEVEIGQAQAWYYLTDKTIMWWECFFHEFVRDHQLLYDPNMRDLWDSFARFLRKRCIGAECITTPFHDPLFDSDEYQEFLGTLGYEPVAKAARGKTTEKC